MEPTDLNKLVPWFVAEGTAWVSTQRNRLRSEARPLPTAIRSIVQPFFDGDILEMVRFAEAPHIANPEFYDALGGVVPLDFTNMAAITFGDTVLLSRRHVAGWTPGLYFHELVHVVQYDYLGVDIFIDRYVQGWAANGFQYRAIPFERDAYSLQARFEANLKDAFSVNEEVRRQLGL